MIASGPVDQSILVPLQIVSRREGGSLFLRLSELPAWAHSGQDVLNKGDRNERL